MTDNQQQPILEVKDLKKHYPIIKGFNRKLVGYTKAVDGVSFAVPAARTLGLVGESGCGKSTTGHCIMRGIEPTAGQVIFHDRERGPIDIAQADPNMLRHVRLNMQMVFQDPSSSMNPRMTVFDIVSEPLVVNNVARGKDLQDRVAELLRVVGLLPEHMQRFPARVQRRPAAEDRGRPLSGAPAAIHHRRRAGVRARRVDPGADAQPAPGPAGAV